MIKDISSGLSKFFTKQRVFTIVMLIFLAIVLLYYTGTKSNIVDGMSMGDYTQSPALTAPVPVVPVVPVPAMMATAPKGSKATPLQPVSNPEDLLPTDSNSAWGNINGTSMNIASPDLLRAGYHIGLDTIGQSLRNANLQLRSDPIIPKQDVGPWNSSTIEPDFGRVPLEVGAGVR
jgi:hypothetical protein